MAKEIGADWIVYQDLSGLRESIVRINPSLSDFDSSCFDGVYVTGDEVTEAYLGELERKRGADRKSTGAPGGSVGNGGEKAQAGAGAGKANGGEEGKKSPKGGRGDVGCEGLFNDA